MGVKDGSRSSRPGGVVRGLRRGVKGRLVGQRQLFIPPSDYSYVALDVETTGLDPRRDRVVQVGLVTADVDLVVTWEGSAVLDPQCDIPAETSAIHGLRSSDVQGAMTFEMLAPWLSSVLEGRRIVGHNLGFDLAFLEHEYARCGLGPPSIAAQLDTLALARSQLPHQRSYRLTELAQALNLQIERAHDACFDALLSLDLLRYLERESSPDR